MSRKVPRGGARGGVRSGAARSGKRAVQQGRNSANPTKTQRPQLAALPQPAALPVIRLGFVRGVAPSKWAERWARSVREQALELIPLDLHEVETARAELDVILERVPPKQTPPGSGKEQRTRHAIRLYEETVALVIAAEHEFARRSEISVADLALVKLLDHPDHFSAWPDPEPCKDPAWLPSDANATLELVATGIGGALLAQPLARHLVDKRAHAVIPLAHDGASLLTGTEIWASWPVERDGADVQRLIGTLRGRTARSSR